MNQQNNFGLNEEIKRVVEINQKIDLYKMKMNLTHLNLIAVHVRYQVYGVIQEKKVFPKADVYMIEALSEIGLKDGYLSEEDLSNFEEDLDYKKIERSGISIKASDSKNYTICKIRPNSFEKIFDTTYLGAGASIYCSSLSDLEKNPRVLKGWGVTPEEFFTYYGRFVEIEKDLSNLETLKKIKTFSNKQISERINNEQAISDYIFQGIGNFKEPYTAHWILDREGFRSITPEPFVVTTGSGRSKGEYTIVIKPK